MFTKKNFKITKSKHFTKKFQKVKQLEISRVTEIPSKAFSNAKKLVKVSISNEVTRIHSGAFQDCYLLTQINIPDSVTNLDHSVFSGCIKLEKIKLSKNITSIEHNTFYNCESLKSIDLSNINHIKKKAFLGCNRLTNITFSSTETVQIDNEVFSFCSSLKTIDIPSTIKVIRYGTFSNCNNLQNIQLSEELTTIEDNAFQGCNTLTSLYIPQSVNNIIGNPFPRDITLDLGIIDDLSQSKRDILLQYNRSGTLLIKLDNKSNVLVEYIWEALYHTLYFREFKIKDIQGTLKPITLQDLGGNTYNIKNWYLPEFKTHNFWEHCRKQHSVLDTKFNIQLPEQYGEEILNNIKNDDLINMIVNRKINNPTEDILLQKWIIIWGDLPTEINSHVGRIIKKKKRKKRKNKKSKKL